MQSSGIDANSPSIGAAELAEELQAALRAQIPAGERIVWFRQPSRARVMARGGGRRWQRATILGGGYSVLIGVAAAWITGQVAWLAIPAVWLTLCAIGLRSEHRALRQRADSARYTAYALTARQAWVVRSRPDWLFRSVPLSETQPLVGPGGQADLVLNPSAGEAAVVFGDLDDVHGTNEFIDQLKAAPEAIEQQMAMVEQWALLAADDR